jgi:hypothetical protein
MPTIDNGKDLSFPAGGGGQIAGEGVAGVHYRGGDSFWGITAAAAFLERFFLLASCNE